MTQRQLFPKEKATNSEIYNEMRLFYKPRVKPGLKR